MTKERCLVIKYILKTLSHIIIGEKFIKFDFIIILKINFKFNSIL